MPAPDYSALQTAVLLCIDDNQEVLQCEKIILESFGYTVLTAASSSLGLELAAKNRVDVIILDYFMPEMNGHEVSVALRRLEPQAQIIMLSGAVNVPEEALKSVDAFVAKECLASQLLPTSVQLFDCKSNSSSAYDA